MHKSPLTKLKKGLKARVVEITGGRSLGHKLSMMGLRPGIQITKLNSFVLKGPVTVRAGHTVLALGHGMAEKVIVEVLPESPSKT
ncbi:MAG: FeoA family protein [Candidatus Omnitrophota bacterium]